MSALVIAITVVAGCGEPKVNEVDGSSDNNMNNSIYGIVKEMPYAEREAVEEAVRIIKYRYDDDALAAKALNGKDVDGIKEEATAAKTYLLHKERKSRVAEEPALIDEDTAKQSPKSKLAILAASQVGADAAASASDVGRMII